jgi:hypothetical protein
VGGAPRRSENYRRWMMPPKGVGAMLRASPEREVLTMDEQDREIQDRISRRRMIKRLGAATAVAWTAPILSTLGSPALAQLAPCYGRTCTEPCPTFGPECGADGPPGNPACICLPAKGPQGEDTCFCHGCVCGCTGAVCTTSAQCPAGWGCIRSCCPGTEFQCAPPCGPQSDPNCPNGCFAAQGVGVRSTRG